MNSTEEEEDSSIHGGNTLLWRILFMLRMTWGDLHAFIKEEHEVEAEVESQYLIRIRRAESQEQSNIVSIV